MPSTADLGCRHGIQAPRRRSLQGLFGLAPLHRAVRNRCAAAAKALIHCGADPRAPNRNGSTPMLLATQNTGKSGSGSTEAKAQQNKILRLLEEHGAT